jgi:hypothetical protein
MALASATRSHRRIQSRPVGAITRRSAPAAAYAEKDAVARDVLKRLDLRGRQGDRAQRKNQHAEPDTDTGGDRGGGRKGDGGLQRGCAVPGDQVGHPHRLKSEPLDMTRGVGDADDPRSLDLARHRGQSHADLEVCHSGASPDPSALTTAVRPVASTVTATACGVFADSTVLWPPACDLWEQNRDADERELKDDHAHRPGQRPAAGRGTLTQDRQAERYGSTTGTGPGGGPGTRP